MHLRPASNKFSIFKYQFSKCLVLAKLGFHWDLELGIWCFFNEVKAMEGFVNPQEVLNQLELEGDMIAADFGSGSGGWAIPLAKRLKFGKVYAIDILEEPLSALKNKAEVEKTFNIETIRSNVEGKKGSKLPSSSCDLVLMTNLLFEAEDKKKILAEGKRVLRKKGKILIVDWLPEAPQGPKKGRVSAEEVKKEARDLKLKLEKEFQAGVFHYGLIFTKP